MSNLDKIKSCAELLLKVNAIEEYLKTGKRPMHNDHVVGELKKLTLMNNQVTRAGHSISQMSQVSAMEMLGSIRSREESKLAVFRMSSEEAKTLGSWLDDCSKARERLCVVNLGGVVDRKRLEELRTHVVGLGRVANMLVKSFKYNRISIGILKEILKRKKEMMDDLKSLDNKPTSLTSSMLPDPIHLRVNENGDPFRDLKEPVRGKPSKRLSLKWRRQDKKSQTRTTVKKVSRKPKS